MKPTLRKEEEKHTQTDITYILRDYTISLILHFETHEAEGIFHGKWLSQLNFKLQCLALS